MADRLDQGTQREQTDLPSGSVAMLFTDIEDSTPLFHALGDTMLEVLDLHHALIRTAIAEHGGHEVKTEGDSFFVAFASVQEAVDMAVDAQRLLTNATWPGGRQVRVRMGVHVGPVHLVGRDYIGVAVAEAARVSSAAHGGQIVVSEAVADAIKATHELTPLGQHTLKGFPGARGLYEVQAPGLRGGFPPLRTGSTPDTNLPAPPTPMVGRAAEREALRRMLSTDARCVTLTGPGGIGKTRLALEVGHDLLAYHQGGVWFVDLEPTDRTHDAIARALGITEKQGTTIVEQIVARLASNPAVLVLDTFDPARHDALGVADLLARCAPLRVLVTAHERLRIRGEHAIALDPLGEDAAALFMARAQAADSLFTQTDDNATDIAAICERCHGIPLALELAAARVRDMPLSALVAGLRQGLDLLSEGERDLPERHQALRATIGWSYATLDAAQQRVFRAMCTFVGGAPVDAIEQVAGARQAVAALADRSLLRFSAERDRVSILEPLRLFGLEHLHAAGEADAVIAAHAAHFAAFAARGEAGIIGPDQQRWVAWLDEEHDNMRAVLSRGPTPARVATAAALGRFWGVRGYWTEGRQWLTDVLADAAGADRLGVLLAAGSLALAQGDLPAATESLREARDVAVANVDALGQGQAIGLLGVVARAAGEAEVARDAFDRAWTIMCETGDERGMALAATNLAGSHVDAGDLDEAAGLYARAEECAAACGDRRLVAKVASNRGLIAQQQGRADAARDDYMRALAFHRSMGDRHESAITLTNLGVLAYQADDEDAARSAWEEALGEARAIGSARLEAQLLTNIGQISGDPREEAAALAQAGEIYRRLGDVARGVTVFHTAGEALGRLELDGANALFAAAADLAGEDPPLLVDVRIAQARVYRAHGQRAHAEALFAEAISIVADDAERIRVLRADWDGEDL